MRLLVSSLLLLAACGGGAELILPGDGQPATIAVVEGDGQSGRVGEPLADPLVFQVTDSRGRPVEGVSVSFDITPAGPGAEIVPEEAETNSEGVVTARVVLGTTVGRQRGQARLTAGGSQPITTEFSAMALSESANSMAAVAGQDQAGRVGQPLEDRLVVEVTDQFGNPVSGVPITWSAEGGGSVSETATETGNDGRARVERILGPAVGRQTTVATSEGLAGSPVLFVHNALAGNASILVIVSGNDQTAAAGSTLPADLVVRLVDAEGNGVIGAALSWVVATGRGSAVPENTVTNDDGAASTRWTLGAPLGEQRLDAVVSGVGFISFRATATAGAPSVLFIRTQPSASAGNGVPFDRQPVIQLRDANGNDVGLAGVQVRASLASGGGELAGTLVRSTDAAGRATFTDLAISGSAGTRTLFFTAEGYAGVTSSEIQVAAPLNRSPVAAFTFNCDNLTCEFTDGSSDPDGGIARYSWNFGDGGQSVDRNPRHTYSAAGPYQVVLTVTDDDEATNSTAQNVLVTGPPPPPPPPENDPPFADFNWHCEGLTCDFTDASEDSDGSITSRSWNFGDGDGSSEENPSHTYDAPGDYTVILTVTDNGGLTDTSDDVVDPEAQFLSMRQQPSSTASPGVTFERQPEIELRAGGDNLERAGVVVTASIASGTGALGGTTTATTDEEGRAQFSNLSISGATGIHTLRFTATGYTEVISDAIDVRKADSDTDIESDNPDPSVAGETIRVVFSVAGDGGTPTGSVAITVSGGTETCSASVAVGFCDLVLNVEGNRTITAIYGGDDRFEGSSDSEGHLVTMPNQTPVASADEYPTTEGVTLTVLAPGVLTNDTDPDDDELTATLVTQAANGTAEVDPNGSFTYAPTAGFTGDDSFTYRASDGTLGSEATVHITVEAAPSSFRMLNLRTQPPSTTTSGARLDPDPEVELLDGTGEEIEEEDVPITVAIASGDGTLAGDIQEETDDDGQAEFEDLFLSGSSGSSVTLVFSAPGYASVDSQPILIE